MDAAVSERGRVETSQSLIALVAAHSIDDSFCKLDDCTATDLHLMQTKHPILLDAHLGCLVEQSQHTLFAG